MLDFHWFERCRAKSVEFCCVSIHIGRAKLRRLLWACSNSSNAGSSPLKLESNASSAQVELKPSSTEVNFEFCEAKPAESLRYCLAAGSRSLLNFDTPRNKDPDLFNFIIKHILYLILVRPSQWERINTHFTTLLEIYSICALLHSGNALLRPRNFDKLRKHCENMFANIW